MVVRRLKGSDVAADDAGTSAISMRFRWVERDLKDLKNGHNELINKVDKLAEQITRNSRNQMIGVAVVIGAGVGSRLFSTDGIEFLKKLVELFTG